MWNFSLRHIDGDSGGDSGAEEDDGGKIDWLHYRGFWVSIMPKR